MARKFVVSVDLNKNELLNARIQNLGSAPSSPVLGQIYYDTSDNKMYFYNGLASPNGPWMPMSASTEVIQDIIGSSINGGVGLTASYDDASGITTVDLDNTAVTAGSYGSTTQIPTFTVDAQGRLTAAGTVNVATTLSIAAEAGVADTVNLLTDTLTFAAGEGIDTLVSNNTITIAGEDATYTNKGVASFADADFTVASGAVSIKNVNLSTQTTGSYIATVAGTDNEVTVTANDTEGANITIGLPDNVTITNDLNVGGNLNVTGSINAVSTTEINIQDNKINLNSNFNTGAPTADAGIKVNRGDQPDVELKWDESDLQWQLTNDGTNYHSITRKFVQAIGNGSATSIAVTHNLGSKDVTVQVYEVATDQTVETDVTRTSSSVVTLGFAEAPATGAYKVVIVG